MNNKYKAFISYSHADKKWAKWLHKELEHYRLPKHLVEQNPNSYLKARPLTPIFRDQDELASSPSLSEKINRALQSSENLIVVCSPNSAASRWVNEEILTFKKLGRSDRIFCIIVDGDPASPNPSQDCFPPALRSFYDDKGNPGNSQCEPIAADLRRDGDGQSLARQKLVAGILDIGLDDLRRREYQRKQRRMVFITGSSLTAMSITIVLALTAVVARNEADNRRQQAEDLLGFMVGDLRTSLTTIGRLDLLEDVGARAMDYFATVDVGDLSDEELSRQAQVFTQLGEIQIDQNNYPAALELFSESHERSSALYEKNPQDGDLLFNRGQAEFWVGFVNWRTGNSEEAEKWFTSYRDTSLELAGLNPNRDDWRREVGYAYQSLAVLAEELGDLDSAAEGYVFFLNILNELAENDRSEALVFETANAISFLGRIALRKGDLHGTKSRYSESSNLLRGSLSRNELNATIQERLATNLNNLTSTYLMMGLNDEANQSIDEAITIFDQLSSRDPSNSNLLRLGSRSRIFKGEALLHANRLEEAENHIDTAINRLQQIFENGANDLVIHQYLASAFLLAANIEFARGDLSASKRAGNQALENMKIIQDENQLSDERRAILANIYLRLASISQIQEPEQANEYLLSATTLLQDQAENTKFPLILDPWTRILRANNRVEEARVIEKALNRSGYLSWPRNR